MSENSVHGEPSMVWPVGHDLLKKHSLLLSLMNVNLNVSPDSRTPARVLLAVTAAPQRTASHILD